MSSRPPPARRRAYFDFFTEDATAVQFDRSGAAGSRGRPDMDDLRALLFSWVAGGSHILARKRKHRAWIFAPIPGESVFPGRDEVGDAQQPKKTPGRQARRADQHLLTGGCAWRRRQTRADLRALRELPGARPGITHPGR